VFAPLAGGAATARDLGANVEPRAIAWAADGASVLVSANGGGDELFNVYRVAGGAAPRAILESDHRRFFRAAESPDGRRLAVHVRDLALDLWLLEHP
jgi:hypothetical protein